MNLILFLIFPLYLITPFLIYPSCKILLNPQYHPSDIAIFPIIFIVIIKHHHHRHHHHHHRYHKSPSSSTPPSPSSSSPFWNFANPPVSPSTGHSSPASAGSAATTVQTRVYGILKRYCWAPWLADKRNVWTVDALQWL